MYVRTARRISSARNRPPTTSRTIAGAVPAFGTAGIAFGIARPITPSISTPTKMTPWMMISGLDVARAAERRQRGERQQRRRRAGTLRPPASAMIPFGPAIQPGVASAWTANSAVMVENAIPIRMLRPSRARAPAMLSASDARLAIVAAALTRPKCTHAGIMK